ncbi:TPA: alpha/beta hydrolase [bacterium]|nr:alpha/beta hydrolase [bacterium]
MLKVSIILIILIFIFSAFTIYAQREKMNSAKVHENMIVFNDIAYVTDGHERQKLDIYLPSQGDNLPLLIWIHGGAWLMGNKDDVPIMDYLEKGYAIASINYRLSSHAIFPAQIEDCKSAIRFLRANSSKYRIDPKRFGVIGASAGGHLVAMLGTTGDSKEFDVGENLDYPSSVQAVVDLFGPTDFLQMDDHRIPNGQVHNDPDSPESLLVGGNIQENKDKVSRANPITYVTKNASPFLIIHGDSDPLVPHHQSVILERALRNAKVPVELYTVKNGGHGGFNDKQVDKLISDFFAEILKPIKPNLDH